MEEIKENIETQESQEMQENGMPKVESTFEELGVSGEILRAIREMGYETPMPVQEKVIPYLLGHNNDRCIRSACVAEDRHQPQRGAGGHHGTYP